MSNVYSFDDKILHIESLQLKRTNEILDSRDEAVDALLNYCGDDTMDGMPLLARYWGDDGHTEIKHVRGYIHNVDGTMGISIDDICDVDRDEIIEIIEEMLSGVTANTINLGHFNKYYEAEEAIKTYEGIGVEGINLIATYDTIDSADTSVNVLIGSTLDAGNGEVKGNLVNPSNVQYWECDEENGLGTHKKQPFKSRNGAYKSAQRELISPGQGDDIDWELGHGGERMEKHEDPTIYITPVCDERRHGSWIGTTPKITEFNQYSILTIDSVFDYHNIGPRPTGWSNVYEWSKPTIIDPRRYEHKIHKALNSSGYVDKNKYVIKKKVPLAGKYFNRYYFQGTGVQFELLPMNPGGVLEIQFDRHFFPFRYFQEGHGVMSGDWKIFAFNASKRYRINDGNNVSFFDAIMNNDVELYFQTGTTYNVMQIRNNTNVRTGYYSVTMEYFSGDSPSDSNYTPERNIIIRNPRNYHSTTQSVAYQTNTSTPDMPYRSAGQGINANEYSKEVSHEAMFVATKYLELEIEFGKKITAETTSPGFRIENGKIKCYRNSDLKEALNEFGCGGWVTYIKNSTSFYYNERNVYNCGITPLRQMQHNSLVRSLFSGSIRSQAPRGGRLTYKTECLATVQRNRTWKSATWRIEDHVCLFTAEYLGFDSDTNKPTFRITKTDSETPIKIGKIGVTFMGADGNMHNGFFSNYNVSGETESNTPFDTGSSTNIITVESLYVKHEHFGHDSYELYPSYSTMRNIVIKYITFDFDHTQEIRPVRFGANNGYSHNLGGVSYDNVKFSRTKWRRAMCRDGATTYPSCFERNYFNRCRYTRIYKNIPSEFSEYFYTR